MSDILIKTAQTKTQIEQIEDLAAKIWSSHYTPIIGKSQVDYMLNKYQSKEAIKNDIGKGYIYYIACISGIACGYSSIKIDEGVFLSKFYVLDSHRNLGIGKVLLNEIYKFAKQNYQSRIWLTCNKNNPSLSVYETLGYKITDECVTDIGNGFVMDDYVLEKIIL